MPDGWEGNWRKVMTAYRRVYDMRVCRCVAMPTMPTMTMHAVTCRLTAWSPGSAPAPYARYIRVWVPFYICIQTKKNRRKQNRDDKAESVLEPNFLHQTQTTPEPHGWESVGGKMAPSRHW